jgi:hypothetical protein
LTLATDEQLNDIVIRATISETTYIHGSPLDYGKTYFWQVKAEKAGPSPVYTFTVENEPVLIDEEPSNMPRSFFIAAIIVLCLIVIVAAVVLLLRKRSRAK